jgi:hypothetical protein
MELSVHLAFTAYQKRRRQSHPAWVHKKRMVWLADLCLNSPVSNPFHTDKEIAHNIGVVLSSSTPREPLNRGIMNRETFQAHLLRAAELAISFAREYVLNDLPDQVVFLVHPNQSCDENPPRGDEETYPEDTQKDDQPITFATAEAVVDYLWRNEKTPEWIDISVRKEDGEHTYLQLLCCGRFTSMEELMYYTDGEVPPFGIKSPDLPPGYDASADELRKFDVNWHEKAKWNNKHLHQTDDRWTVHLLHSIRSVFRKK